MLNNKPESRFGHKLEKLYSWELASDEDCTSYHGRRKDFFQGV